MEIYKALKELAPTAILIGLALAAFIYGLVSKFRKPKHPTLAHDVKFSLPIYNTLGDMLHIIRITRSFVLQFHNGNEYYSGQKIQRMTMSHEKCLPTGDVRPMKRDHDGVLVPDYVHTMMQQMEKDRQDWYWCSDLKSIKNSIPDLYEMMREFTVMSILFFQIFDKKTGEPIGLMGLTFNHNFRLMTDGDDINTNDILRLRPYKKDIEAEFNKI